MMAIPPPDPLTIIPGKYSWSLEDIDDDDSDSDQSEPVLAVRDSDGPVPDTPILMKASLQPEAHGGLSETRDITMDEIGSHIKQIPVDSFLNEFLPRLQQTVNLDDVIDHLKTTGEEPVLTDHGWKDLILRKKEHEDRKYEALESIVAAIIAAGISLSGHASVLEYVQWPRKGVQHRDFPNSGLPDGYGYIPDPANPHPQDDGVFWHQLIFSAQFKKVDATGKINNVSIPLKLCVQAVTVHHRTTASNAVTWLRSCAMTLLGVSAMDIQ